MDDDVIHMMRKLIEKCKSEDFYMYISNEFFNLKEFSSEILYSDSFSSNYGALDFNNYKNRYKDILPFDKCRVVLDNVDDNEGSDYVNASFVHGVEGTYSYIGAQAPLKTTVADFMRMLWQYNVKVLICACNELEGNKPKCFRYWPNDETEVFNFDKIEVKLLNLEIDSSNEFVKREILLRKIDNNEERVITQLHMVNWPDHGVPDNIDPIIKMLEISHSRLDEASINKKDEYLVVHCSAGCGRTGTIVALDYCWNLLKSCRLNSDFTPFKIGKMLREQRTAMIQTFDQYKMFYEALEYLFNNYLSSNRISRDTMSPPLSVDINNNNNENNERIHSSSSKMGGLKKVLDKIRPSSTSSSKKIAPTSATTTTKQRISSSSSNSAIKNEYNTQDGNNLPILYKESDYYESSIDNFEFKPIPIERFNSNQIDGVHDCDDRYEINNGDSNNEEEEEEEEDSESDSKLISNSVGGVADSIFGKTNFSSTKLKRNNSLKFDDNSENRTRGKQSMSASFVSSSIKSYKPEYVDLKLMNPPLKAQLSNNLHNPSPPVSARSNYEYRLREQTEILTNRSAYTPTPPPRNKYKNKSNLFVGIATAFRKDDDVNNNNSNENTYKDKYCLPNDSNSSSSSNSNNNTKTNNQFISKTEHLV